MASVILNGATSGSTTITPTDAVTVSLTLPSTSGTLALAGSSTSSISNGTSNVTVNSSGGTVTVATAGTTAVTVDTSQNIGVGVTPSAWYTASSVRALQFNAGSIWTYSTNQFFMTQNAYYGSGGDTYYANGYATQYNQNSGSHIWKIAPSGTAGNTITFTSAMTLDNTGKLGLGTTTPDIEGNGSNYLGLTIYNPTALYPATQIYATQSTSSAAAEMGRIHFLNGTNRVCQILVKPDGANNNSAYYALSTMKSGTLNEAYRVDSSGNLLVNTTSVFGGGKICTVFDGSVTNGINLKTTYASTGSQFAAFYNSAGTQIGYINQNATTTVNYNTSSDSRLKTLIGVATDTSVIDGIVINDFTWKIDGATDRGVFAQDLYNIKPTAVSKGRDDTLDENGFPVHPWGVDYSKLVPDLIVYCQHLKAELNALKAKVG
jgi:hypothetical protein